MSLFTMTSLLTPLPMTDAPVARAPADEPELRQQPEPLHPDWRVALEGAAARWARDLGTGSCLALERAARSVLATSEVSPAQVSEVLARVERAHRMRHGHARLAAEYADERERDRASEDDGALVLYHAKWQRKLKRLEQAHPERWRVAELSREEVRDALTLRLVEALRAAPGEREPGQAGKEWGLCVMERHLSDLRRRFRLRSVPADFSDAPALPRGPDQETAWLEHEADACRALAGARAERQLSRPQRRWLVALKDSAASGGFFESSDRPNLSAASRRLGKNRSSAQRAYEMLQRAFQRELEHIE